MGTICNTRARSAQQLADEIIAPDGRAVSHGGDIG